MARRKPPQPVVMRKKESSVITIHLDPLKVSKGHQPYRSGAGIHLDRRTKRHRTRCTQCRAAVREFE